jgi:hypothetical protein
MKKILVLILILQSLNSCKDDKTSTVSAPKNSSNIIDQVDFSKISDEQIEFIKSQKDILYSKNLEKKDFDKFANEYETKFKSPMAFTFEKYSKGMQRLTMENNEARMSLTLDDKVFSKDAISLVEKIRDLLNNSGDEKSFEKNFKEARKLILENNKISANEKKLFTIKLDFLKEIASTSTSNARLKNITEGPKCKWYQWGCVFYMTTAQVAVIFSIWAANDSLGNYQLSLLVSEYGLDYIAECCGFCGCNCPDGCPRWV